MSGTNDMSGSGRVSDTSGVSDMSSSGGVSDMKGGPWA